ncbi:MAG: polysaccharide-degrading enzyme [bacterium]|nr:polysaccharide-degrading enzyme [bacterium]
MDDHARVNNLSRVARLAIGLAVLVASAGRAADYEVGDGKPYASVGSVPWESLEAGDTVLIHWRSSPYKEKWVIGGQGTAVAPITVRGVPGPSGQLPVIDGEDATTRVQLDYWNENRSVIKIGGSSVPPEVTPQYVVIENLDVRGARSPNTFTDDHGVARTYALNAASVHVERGEHIVIRGCIIRDSGNGLFVSSSDTRVARDILIEGNHIHGNGNLGRIYEHNVYTAAIGITYQWNRFGPLLDGAGGNNLKDRSAGLVVRYNWLEGGNRQLDLVDAEDSWQIRDDSAYSETHVYGNILIEPEAEGNKQIVHYGGDSGTTAWYRQGTLHFYHNTLVSLRSDGTTLLRLSTNSEHCDARNNILYVTGAGDSLAMLDSDGVLDLSHNWIKPGWLATFGSLGGAVNDDGTSVEGVAPGFVHPNTQDYHLLPGSACVDAATVLHSAVLPNHDVVRQYTPHPDSVPRPISGGSDDLGAFEFLPGDADGDGIVDLGDYSAFELCLLGPVTSLGPTCDRFDLDTDEDVDLRDFAGFMDVFTGG